jgi:putative transposase
MKSKKDHRQSFRLTRNGFRIRPNGRLFVAKVGEVRVRWSRELPTEPSSVTIIREPDGHYYASFVVDVESTPLPAVAREAGVDVGIARLGTVAATDGEHTDIANPKHLDVPVVRRGPRPGPQRRQGHSRRRAGGETKRLPREWAGPRKQFRWSTNKTSLREAWCR